MCPDPGSLPPFLDTENTIGRSGTGRVYPLRHPVLLSHLLLDPARLVLVHRVICDHRGPCSIILGRRQ